MLQITDWERLIENECKLRGYSKRTMENYTYHIRKYLISKKSVKEYLLSLINKKKSDETVRSAGFALKFYLKILNKDSSEIDSILKDIPNVKKEKKLPAILSKEEIQRMILTTNNLNHRLIIQIGYSSGLRSSEINVSKIKGIQKINTLSTINGIKTKL